MEEKLCSLMLAMIDYNSGDAKRIQHFIKVHAFAKLIGIEEGLDVETQYVLEAAALTHDIGIKNSEKKYGTCSGKQQELDCLLYTSPSPRDLSTSRMPSSA